jgi:hypothetical protein
MVQISIPRGAPLAGIALLALAAAVLLGLALHPAVGVLGALLGLLVLAFALVGVAYRGRSRPLAARPARLPGPVAQRSVQLAGGLTRQAQVVTQTDGFQFVLTVDGYMLVDDRGQVVYKLKR